VPNNHSRVFENKRGLHVEVRNNNVEKAIRTLGRMVKQDGLIKELRAREAYEKPSTRRHRERCEAISRWRKYLATRED
jgi:small subunit ribosomal protein S21